MRLSDLLDDVRADAPPPRYDVEDAVRAGKRLRLRRRAGWATAAGAAAIVAIGVPQIVTRADSPPRPITPAVTTPAPAPTAGKAGVEFEFAGYDAGPFRVADPTGWTFAGDTAVIRKTGSDQQAGLLQVFRPGVYPFSRSGAGYHLTDTARVDGGRAYFVERNGDRWLAWEYGGGAVAVVKPQNVRGLSDAELRQVAEAFTPGTPTPVRVAFKAGYVAGDYTLAEVAAHPDSGIRTAANFVPAVQVMVRLHQPDRGLPPGTQGQASKVLSIRVTTPSERTAMDMPTKTRCVDGHRAAGSKQAMGGSCGRPLSGGKYVLEVVGGPAISQSELLKVLNAVEVADPAKPSTWLPVSSAIPASHLPVRG
ncbi:hypothetical protein ACQPZX_01265 [Actinoplanes sp. CA-142083]|uniref:hypothetical protein n=1 Tax=Actinoplanes sp. CA-142083 TaxID=3239903 RepID=UPI003D937CFE